MSLPDPHGHFGEFGGRYVPETLMQALTQLSQAFAQAQQDPCFQQELDRVLHLYAGRPTPLFPAETISKELGARVYLKREDLTHTGSHKINNALGQALLAKSMGKRMIIAETGAGQHGVATASASALLGLDCTIFMGEEDLRRQALNVYRMELLGARVVPVHSGSRTLKDAVNEAIRHWVAHVEISHYIIGSVVGPHPYPLMVREFQRVIGLEARRQILQAEGRLPDQIIACVGGGSNAMGIFHPFLTDQVQLIGVEAAGLGLETQRHAASLTLGRPGVIHGAYTYLLQDPHGQILEAHSISAGLDYPGVGPEHAHLHATGRAHYRSVTDQEALEAFGWLSRTEGIIPAMESSHALAYLRQARFPPDSLVILCLSGRGDKDLAMLRKEGEK